MTDPVPGAGGDSTNEQTNVGAPPAVESPPGSPVPTPATSNDTADAAGVQAEALILETGHGGTTEATETTDEESEEEEDEEEVDDEDEEPRLKYARLTQNLAGVYKNADATSSFLVAGDKMVWNLVVYQLQLAPLADLGHRSSELTTATLCVHDKLSEILPLREV